MKCDHLCDHDILVRKKEEFEETRSVSAGRKRVR